MEELRPILKIALWVDIYFKAGKSFVILIAFYGKGKHFIIH